MQIINNFVKPSIQDELEALFSGNSFPYYYSKESCVPPGYKEFEGEDPRLTGDAFVDENTIESVQFSHILFSATGINSDYYIRVLPIINKLIDSLDGDYRLYRCKVNLNLADVRFGGKYLTPHIDNGFEDQVTAVYYVNDADGDTVFFDDDSKISNRVTPEKGKLVWWKGKVFHAKSYSVNSATRIVLNINLLPCEN